jgi:hypothetical protein
MEGWAVVLAFLQFGSLVGIVGGAIAIGRWTGRTTSEISGLRKETGRIADAMTIQNGRIKRAEEQLIRIDQRCEDNVCRYGIEKE